MLKHGAIADPAYLGRLVDQMADLRRCDPAVMAAAVLRSCEIKSEVVSADERESGRRATRISATPLVTRSRPGPVTASGCMARRSPPAWSRRPIFRSVCSVCRAPR
ncbi:MAG: hypothetical protein R3E83_08260 [Burkholderiaceae bacterium]